MTATVVPFHSSPEPTFLLERVPAPQVEPCAIEVTEDFETLRDRGRELVATGSYREAAVVYRHAAQAATAAGEADLADEAFCGWGAAETELGNGVNVMPELRRILLGSAVDHNCCLAAYTLARAHELDGQIKKALFYARLFRDRAEYVEREGMTGLAHSLLGNLLVAEGRDADAANCYRTALQHYTEAPPIWTAIAETNLGYCLLARATAAKRLRSATMREGLRLLYRSIRTFRRGGAIQYTMLPHQDLCFAHLELKRPVSARRHGIRALELAEGCRDLAVVKNCLYLLGQVAMLQRDAEAANAYFSELEQRFYPEQTGLATVLMSLDLRQVVNLRA